ncbi:hypothetical protein DFH11DRAFT_1768670 [Phellopilus nigrolimitatus]|nr:hypothetical protein DFH11DRAFT_1768670 [Phellopilus nigrolimitatus]
MGRRKKSKALIFVDRCTSDDDSVDAMDPVYAMSRDVATFMGYSGRRRTRTAYAEDDILVSDQGVDFPMYLLPEVDSDIENDVVCGENYYNDDDDDDDDAGDADDTPGLLPVGDDDDDDVDAVSRFTSDHEDPNVHYISDYVAKSGRGNQSLYDWIPHRDDLLDELHRHDGFLQDPAEQCSEHDEASCTKCTGCGYEISGVFRCKDCFQSAYMCSGCMVERHTHGPLHRVEQWCKTHWRRTSLAIMGLVVAFGHKGGLCPNPEPLARTVTVIDVSGIHKVKVSLCDCSAASAEAGLPHNQYLRVGWFPATYKHPRTVVTFSCLAQFHLLTVQGKVTGFDYYQTLVRLTDNTNIDPPPRRYEEFMRVCRLWRHLKLLKRAGVALDPGGVASAKPGSCAIECPACPHPIKNPRPLSDNEDENNALLDTLFVMMDANFRLKCKDRKFVDPSLGSGLAFYVEETAYDEYLSTCPPQEEINICDSGLHAVDHANTRGVEGYSSTGLGACQCRHMLVRPNGVGDLQRGEKYCNMDYIFFSAISGSDPKRLVISYDIACQWSRNILTRSTILPSDIQFDLERAMVEHMARTDGENIERGWAWMNPASLSTREMGPGARRDTLDDQWCFWNIVIRSRLGTTLARRLEEAVLEARDQRRQHIEFTKTFPPATVAQWSAMVDIWNKDPHKAANPYSEPEPDTTIVHVRRELIAEENAETMNGTMPLHATSASQMLTVGFELEEQQNMLKALSEGARKKSKDNSRTLAVENKDSTLRRKIVMWQNIQRMYMPGIAPVQLPVRSTTDAPDDISESVPPSVSAIDIPLNLPSSLSADIRHLVCVPNLVEKELRLRIAQADDALNSLRKHLRIGATVFDFKKMQTAGTGTKPNTRMQSLITKYKLKTDRAADRYRTARRAVLCLDPGNREWRARLPLLNAKDVRPPKRNPEEAPSEGRWKMSWIWTSAKAQNNESHELHESLRFEWAKSLARAERWEEEVKLVKEEMRRTLAFFEYQARWWRTESARRQGLSTDISSGLRAYAEKQAFIYEAQAADFASLWLQVHDEYTQARPTLWPSRYLSLEPTVKQYVGFLAASGVLQDSMSFLYTKSTLPLCQSRLLFITMHVDSTLYAFLLLEPPAGTHTKQRISSGCLGNLLGERAESPARTACDWRGKNMTAGEKKCYAGDMQ